MPDDDALLWMLGTFDRPNVPGRTGPSSRAPGRTGEAPGQQASKPGKGGDKGKGGGKGGGVVPGRGHGGGGGGGGGAPATPFGDGFGAVKLAADGSNDTTVDAWDTAQHNDNSDFDETTGVWTVPATGIALMFGGGFPLGGNPSGQTWTLKLQENSSDVVGALAQAFCSNAAHGHSALLMQVRQAVAGEEYSLYQGNDTADKAFFSAMLVEAADVLSAYKVTATGSANGVITGWTENFDLNDNFDDTTGVYTVPTTGKYLVSCGGYAGSTTTTHGPLLQIDTGGGFGSEGVYTHAWKGNGSIAKTSSHVVVLDLTAADELRYIQQGFALGDCMLSIVRLENFTHGFSCRRALASGSIGGLITLWDAVDYDTDSLFNVTTGVFTAARAGKHLVTFYGHDQSGTNAESGIQMNLNTVASGYHGREYTQFANHDDSHGVAAIIDLAVSDTLDLTQLNRTMNDVYFSVTEMFE